MSVMAFAEQLKTGTWRFEWKAGHATVPFIVEFQKKGDVYSGILKNGKENIKLDEIQVSDELIKIPLQNYEIDLQMDFPKKEGTMTGYWIRHNKNPKVTVPVFATYGETERFPEGKSKPRIDLNGRWAVTLTDSEDKKESGVIIFNQKGNDLSGSILTPTGDYRYMEGFVSGFEFEAASFDGMYNYIIKGRVKDGNLEANILANYKTKVTGVKDNKAELPDAYKQTQLESLAFEFPDLNDKKMSLDDPKFKNKPVIVQIFGSWCPNCMDEMNYLIPWYKENNKRGIEVVALAFERSLSPEDAKKQLLKTQKKKNVNYPLLIAGSTAEDKPMDKIKGLKNFISFPTTVFLNRKHEVVKVHAGFSGPSTGEFFDRWKKEFNQTVNELLKK